MRVLVAYNDYLQAGGERFSVATQVEALRAHGAEVELVQVDNEALAAGGLRDRVRNVMGDPAVTALVAERIDTFRPDVCHAENLFPRLGAGAIEVMAERRVPWVRTFRNYRVACVDGSMRRAGAPCGQCTSLHTRLPGVVHRCYHGSLSASLGATVQVSRDARAMRAHPPAAHIFISNFLRRTLDRSLEPNVPAHVVPNAVDLAAARTPAWESRGIDVAFVGRLSPEKGLPLVMDAARALPTRTFAIMGAGPLAEQVAREARDLANVSVLGQVDQERMAQVLGDSRVVMVPSQWEEPFGRVSIEAQRRGAVPLVSKLGGLPETLPEPYRDRLAVAGADPAAWVGALAGVLTWKAQEAGDFGSHARAAWEREHSPQALATRLLAIYEEAC